MLIELLKVTTYLTNSECDEIVIPCSAVSGSSSSTLQFLFACLSHSISSSFRSSIEAPFPPPPLIFLQFNLILDSQFLSPIFCLIFPFFLTAFFSHLLLSALSLFSRV